MVFWNNRSNCEKIWSGLSFWWIIIVAVSYELETHIFICIRVNNNTFIAYYSYPVGLICPPIQHLHDITEVNKGVKGMWLALEEQYGCHMLPCAAVAIGGCKGGCLSKSGLLNRHLCIVPRLDCFGCSCTFYWGKEGIWGMLPLNLVHGVTFAVSPAQWQFLSGGDLS